MTQKRLSLNDLIERLNERCVKYFTAKNTLKYNDVLQKFVVNINTDF